MPVQYSGIIDEHHAVRNAVGLFDVSHMGEIEIRGPEAAAAGRLRHHQRRVAKLQDRPGALFRPALRTRRIRRRHPGPQSGRRSLFPLRQRLQPGEGFRAHPRRTTVSTREVEFASDALRADRHPGPEGAGDAAEADAGGPRARSSYYWFADGEVCGRARAHRAHRLHRRGRLRDLRRARTRPRASGTRSCEAGAEFGIKPCGLGARNTLRLEAKMALYGHEIDASITPLEADLAWIVKLDKGDFVGRDALLQAEGKRRHAQAGRLRNARPRHRPRRLRSVARRRARGLGDQRLARAHA